jgi:hypothetical protein
MPTLMSKTTHAKLDDVRSRLVAFFGAGTEVTSGVGGVFVPWTGTSPLDNGIYYVGIGLHEDITPEGESYEESLRKIDQDCLIIATDRRHTPYWAFLGELTSRLWGTTPTKAADRWGWSNLIKIGWSTGAPAKWPEDVIAKQAEACGDALKEELTKVRNSLVLITSNKPYGVIERAFGDQSDWNKDQTSPWLWWKVEPSVGNLIVHTDHAKPLRLRGFWEPALVRICELCREHGVPSRHAPEPG